MDAALLAAGMRPKPPPQDLAALVPEYHTIGDAKEPRDAESAVQEGYKIGAMV